ncbi:MAG: transposase domain-containing protein [Parvularculaceae bacterium]
MYTLVETANLNGVDQQAWLAHVIETTTDHSMIKIDDLLP